MAPYFFDWITHRTDGPYWQQRAPQRYYPKITIPVLNIEGWYDAFLDGGVRNFTGMVSAGGTAFARNNQWIVTGPWGHLGWVGPTALRRRCSSESGQWAIPRSMNSCWPGGITFSKASTMV